MKWPPVSCTAAFVDGQSFAMIIRSRSLLRRLNALLASKNKNKKSTLIVEASIMPITSMFKAIPLVKT